MPPSKVYLIGENHYDLRKSERYARAFDRFKPDVITVEASEKVLLKLSDYVSRCINQHQFSGRENWLTSVCGGSFASALDYKHLHDGTTILQSNYSSPSLDQRVESIAVEDALSQWRIAEWRSIIMGLSNRDLLYFMAFGVDEMLSYARNNLSFLEASVIRLLQIIGTESNAKISAVSRILDCIYLLDEHMDGDLCESEQKDTYIAKEIIKQSGIVVHCGGINHMFGEYNNLYERLSAQGLDVERYKLIDFTPELLTDPSYKNDLKDIVFPALKMVIVEVITPGLDYLFDTMDKLS